MDRLADLRSYLSVLDELGDIEHVTRVVNADLEAAAITRRSTEQRKPAPLFERIAGFGAGFRMVGAPGALSGIPGHPLARVSLSVGLPHTTTACRASRAPAAGGPPDAGPATAGFRREGPLQAEYLAR